VRGAGSRNVNITGNQFSHNDLWAIGLMPGAASHPAVDGKPETANADGGSIVANNVIIAGGPNTPQGLHFSNNIFTPGTKGVANRDLQP